MGAFPLVDVVCIYYTYEGNVTVDVQISPAGYKAVFVEEDFFVVCVNTSHKTVVSILNGWLWNDRVHLVFPIVRVHFF